MDSSNSEEDIYCICKSSDVDRFMIGCDHCNDWFHGDCVDITERESKYVKKYYCDECRAKNKDLAIVFRSKYKEKAIEIFKEKGKRKESKASHGKTDSKRDLKEKYREKEKKHKDHDRERDKKKHRHRDHSHHHHHHKEKKKDKSRDNDRDRHKERQKEKEDRKPQGELLNERVTKEKTLVESQRKEEKIAKEDQKRAEELALEQAKSIKEALERKQREQEILKARAEQSRAMAESRKRALEENVSLSSAKKQILSERNFISSDEAQNDDDNDDEEDVWEPPKVAVERRTKEKIQAKKIKKTPAIAVNSRNRRGRRAKESSSEEEPEVDTTPKQCFGPNCVKVARIGSKYCSDQCGINLASTRIYEILPERIERWKRTPCAAEKRDMKALEKIRAQQMAVKNRLEQLNKDFQELEELIAKGKSKQIEENSDDEEDEPSEMTIYCVTCGANIQTNTAIRHMERCYNKFESQTSFASKFKTQIEDHRMFCDYFNPKEQSYCKRLKVLCPEHNPDPKIPDEEVCGYPIQNELFGKLESFCLKAKKTCHQHFCWEKLRRAELDMERVKQWMKVDELLEQERQVKAALTSRSGVLGLMLHTTIDHEELGRMYAYANANARRQQSHLVK